MGIMNRPSTRNLEVAAGLREVADWLDEHPELPDAQFALVIVRNRYTRRGVARAELSLIARALGDRAEESQGYGDVTITGLFSGDVRVDASAAIAALRPDLPPTPEYEPIIPAGVGA